MPRYSKDWGLLQAEKKITDTITAIHTRIFQKSESRTEATNF